MRSRLGIITKDDIFLNKIKLLLRNEAEVVRIAGGDFSPIGYDAIFVDVRTEEIPDCRCVTFGDGGDIGIPFKHEEALAAFKSALSGEAKAGIKLSDDGKHAYVLGNAVSLTKLEYKLLARLLDEAVGSYVSRDTLLKDVWGGECDAGVVVVYMHYLRKKIETGGEKVIVTKRDRGDSKYKIDERYRGGK